MNTIGSGNGTMQSIVLSHIPCWYTVPSSSSSGGRFSDVSIRFRSPAQLGAPVGKQIKKGIKMKVFSRFLFVTLPFLFLSMLNLAYAQGPIVHQISLPAGENWCDDGMINGLFSQVNGLRATMGLPALAMDSVGMHDAEIRATQVIAYFAANSPNTPGFNPHQGYDTTAASLGYNLISENLAWITSDPVYIVYAIWQDPLHLAAMLAPNANLMGVSCVYSSGGTPFWTYEPGQGTPTTSNPPSGPVPDSEGWAFLTLINNYRQQNGVGPLQVSAALEASSTWMSNDMATHNYVAHNDSLGRSPSARFPAFGYPYSPWGENIAAGFADEILMQAKCAKSRREGNVALGPVRPAPPRRVLRQHVVAFRVHGGNRLEAPGAQE